MKKVYVRYPHASGTKERKIKIPKSATASALRQNVVQYLPQFLNQDFFFICQAEDGVYNLLDEQRSFDVMFKANKVKVQLFHKTVDAIVEEVDGVRRTVTICMQDPVSVVISKMNIENPEKYVFCFKLKTDSTYYRISARSISLALQGWTNETLYLLRIVTPSDIDPKLNPELFLPLFKHCRMAARLGLSLYSAEIWGKLIYLNHIAEGKDAQTLTQKVIMQNIPDSFRGDQIIANYVQDAASDNKGLSAMTAKREYVLTAVTKGSPVCFIDRIKFWRANREWRQTARICYISPTSISIMRDFGKTYFQIASLASITRASYDSESVSCIFDNNEQWRLRSDRPHVLFTIIEDYRAMLSYNPDGAKSIGVDMTDYSDLSDAQKMTSTENEDFILTNIASVKQQDDVSDIHQKIPGISPLICPKPEEGDQPYSIDNQLYRDLRIIEPLVFIKGIDGSEKDAYVPDVTPLFKIGSFFVLRHHRARVFFLCLLVVALMAAYASRK